MNLPKFVGEDIMLFNAILSDIFRGVEVIESSTSILRVLLFPLFNLMDKLAIDAEIAEQGLQPHPELVQKILQVLKHFLTANVLSCTTLNKLDMVQ